MIFQLPPDVQSFHWQAAAALRELDEVINSCSVGVVNHSRLGGCAARRLINLASLLPTNRFMHLSSIIVLREVDPLIRS